MASEYRYGGPAANDQFFPDHQQSDDSGTESESQCSVHTDSQVKRIMFLEDDEGRLKERANAMIYRDIIRWVAAQPRTQDSRSLTQLVIFLSSEHWSYAGVAAWTEQMSEAALTLALRAIKQYLETGRCHELQRVSAELRSTLLGLH